MSDLRGVRIETTGSTWTKIVALVIVAIVVVAAGVYTYETWPAQPPKSVVASSELPSPSPPVR